MTPISTFDSPPKEGERVMYYFQPFGRWYIGEWDGGCHFTSKSGFCDWHDAPYWMPCPPPPDGVDPPLDVE